MMLDQNAGHLTIGIDSTRDVIQLPTFTVGLEMEMFRLQNVDVESALIMTCNHVFRLEVGETPAFINNFVDK